MKVILFLFIVAMAIPTVLTDVNQSYAAFQGCHKPYVTWLYPRDHFNLSGIVTVYWSESEADYYETITYSLFYSVNNSMPRLIIKGLGETSYDLNTNLLPQNQTITLIVESFDQYNVQSDTVSVHINQSRSVTPLDPSVIKNSEACPFNDSTSSLTVQNSSKPLRNEFITIFSGLTVIIILYKLKKRKN